MSIPSQTQLKIIGKMYTAFEKQGISILIMGGMLWGCYLLLMNFQKTNNEDRADEKKLNDQRFQYMINEVKDCKTYTRDVFQIVIEDNTKVMERVLDKLDD